MILLQVECYSESRVLNGYLPFSVPFHLSGTFSRMSWVSAVRWSLTICSAQFSSFRLSSHASAAVEFNYLTAEAGSEARARDDAATAKDRHTDRTRQRRREKRTERERCRSAQRL